MGMEYNKSPISLREGHVYIDGIEVADAIKCNIVFTPDVWQGQQLGEQGYSSRWLGFKISGTITRRRSTNWLKEKIKEYKNTGITPEMKIQGIMDDAGSDYYDEFGKDTITVVGAVLTGDLTLTDLDSGGDVLEDDMAFNAKDVIF